MKATNTNINLIETYFGLLKNLSADSKLELIAKLSNSLKKNKRTKSKLLKETLTQEDMRINGLINHNLDQLAALRQKIEG